MIPTASGLPDPGAGARIGRYVVSEEIGRGAMGVVYRATDPALGRTVALKTIRLQAATAAERQAHVDRLRREAQSGGRLLHPNIVTVFDFFESGETAFVCMEFIDGPSLEAVLAAGHALDPAAVTAWLQQAAAALEFAHERGIVHRDIKPANLLLQDGRTLKISDFGIARILSEEATATGPLMGTPSYMSPEQAQSKSVGGRADQFSLAVIAYELLTGVKPFEGYSLASVVYKVCHEVAAPASSLNPVLHPAVDQVLARALQKDPALRFPTAGQFVAALSRSLQQSPGWRPIPRRQSGQAPTLPVNLSSTAATPLAAKLPPPAPRPRSLWWGAILGFLLAGGAFWLVVNRNEPLKIASLIESANPVESDQKPSAAGDAASPPENGAGESAPPDAQAARPNAEAAVGEMTPAPGANDPPPAPSTRPGTQTTPDPAAPPQRASQPPEEEPRFAAHPVEIGSEPPGATVVIDDNPSFTCTTPCQLTLGTGRHTLRFSRDGYRPSHQSIDVPQALTSRVRLEPRTGTVMVKSNPTGATVLIDGREWRSKTPTMITLPSGRHRLILRLPDLPDEVSDVEIRDNAVATLEVNWKQ